ncbi:MAG TPA: hypothetical protein VGE72_19660 [Azospirillum sp.]
MFNIIRQERQEIEGELEKEEHRPAPDIGRLAALRQQATSLQRELEHFPET